MEVLPEEGLGPYGIGQGHQGGMQGGGVQRLPQLGAAERRGRGGVRHHRERVPVCLQQQPSDCRHHLATRRRQMHLQTAGLLLEKKKKNTFLKLILFN